MKYLELFKIYPHMIKNRNYKCFRILEIQYVAFELEKLEKMVFLVDYYRKTR